VPLTEEQLQEIAKKEKYLQHKEQLLEKRKALRNDLSYAQDRVEEGLIEEERERLAAKIRSLAAKIREIETWETEAKIG